MVQLSHPYMITGKIVALTISSVAPSCLTLCGPMNYSTPGLPAHHQLPESTQTHIHWVSHAIQPSHPLLSPSPPALNLSQHQGLFKWVSIRWPKYWSFSFNISATNEHPGLISFRMDWLDLLAVQGTLKSLLQHQRSKALTVGTLNNWDVTKLRVTRPPATPSTSSDTLLAQKARGRPGLLLFAIYCSQYMSFLNPSRFVIRAGSSQTSSLVN